MGGLKPIGSEKLEGMTRSVELWKLLDTMKIYQHQ